MVGAYEGPVSLGGDSTTRYHIYYILYLVVLEDKTGHLSTVYTDMTSTNQEHIQVVREELS